MRVFRVALLYLCRFKSHSFSYFQMSFYPFKSIISFKSSYLATCKHAWPAKAGGAGGGMVFC